jgi:hypothetical protein
LIGLTRVIKKIGLTRVIRKVDLNATTVSYNLFRLNAQSKWNIKQRFKIKDKEYWLNTPELTLIQS